MSDGAERYEDKEGKRKVAEHGAAIDKALSGASAVTKEQVDGDSADEVKARGREEPAGYDRVAPNQARPCST